MEKNLLKLIFIVIILAIAAMLVFSIRDYIRFHKKTNDELPTLDNSSLELTDSPVYLE